MVGKFGSKDGERRAGDSTPIPSPHGHKFDHPNCILSQYSNNLCRLIDPGSRDFYCTCNTRKGGFQPSFGDRDSKRTR
jgi:hypothetical protein